ncbi:MAG: O-antigen ligase family protein [Candidatus Coatesbacteria bacterium]|nr:O-antigen ligase family protein [Candidatus Coatesbacteria bacterium]
MNIEKLRVYFSISSVSLGLIILGLFPFSYIYSIIFILAGFLANLPDSIFPENNPYPQAISMLGALSLILTPFSFNIKNSLIISLSIILAGLVTENIWNVYKPKRILLLDITSFLVIIFCILSIFQFFIYGIRARATLYRPNSLGMFMIFVLPFIIAGVREEKGFRFVFYAIALLSGITGLVLTFSRGAWLGFAGSIIFFFLFYRNNKYLKYILFASVILLLVIALTVPLLEAKIFSIFTTDSSSNTKRLFLWQAAIKAISLRPLTGYGAGTFPDVYKWFKPEGAELYAWYPHNIYLHILADLGIIGLLVFSFLVFWISRKFYSDFMKTRSFYYLAALASFMAILVQGLVDY